MITIHELTRRFQTGGSQILAVDHLSFVVSAGEVYGLLGPNGAGKTTTIRMIVGLLQPDSGYAEVAGFRTSESPDEVKSRVGLVSSNDGVYPWLSVREMLLFFADLYGLAPRGEREPTGVGGFVRTHTVAGSALRLVEHRPASTRNAGAGADPLAAGGAAR